MRAVIGRKYSLNMEQEDLEHYMKDRDFTTFMVVLFTVLGYIRGEIREA